jgi:hypothetical protein
MVTAAIDNGSGLLGHARLGRLIGLNVLAHDQEQIASGFARKGADRFARGSLELGRRTSPD